MKVKALADLEKKLAEIKAQTEIPHDNLIQDVLNLIQIKREVDNLKAKVQEIKA